MKSYLDQQRFCKCFAFVFLMCNFCPICTPFELCADPPEALDAEPNPDSGNLRPPFSVGTNLSYVCHDGYKLRSNDSAYAICLQNNSTAYWHLNHFKCEPACKGLPTIPHAELKMNGRSPPFLPNETISYECSSGYNHKQGITLSELSCTVLDGVPSWVVPNDPCLPVSCSYPGDIENARFVGSTFTFGKNVTYKCNEGFKIIGSPTIYCMASRNWRPNVPSCEAIICPLLADLENGKIINSDFKFKAVAIYECHANYRLKGSAQRVCQADATWSENAPTCEAIFCLHPGILENGRVLPNRTDHKAGDVVIFVCDDGQTHTSKCLETGEWSKRPPACTGVQEVTVEKTTVTTAPPPTRTTDSDKRINSCDDPGDIKNGKKIITGITPNSTATYSCEDGYQLRGKGMLTCLESGRWNLDKLPICVKPISTLAIILIVIGLIVILGGSLGAYFWYRWRAKKVRGYGEKSKALTADATDMDEITGFGKRPIPVTVL